MRSSSTPDNDREEGDHHAWVAELVRRIQQGGGEDDFELLFRAYEPRVRARLRKQGWRGADLDDLVQDVMLRVYRGIGNFRLEASFDTWILKIMSNANQNAIRDRNTGKARATRTSLEDLYPRTEIGDRRAEPASSDDSPLDESLAAERKARLAAALDQLPSRVRQCLLFRYQGYKYREIAKAQGVSITTVKKQISQGHKRLRPILGRFVELFGVFLVLVLVLACT